MAHGDYTGQTKARLAHAAAEQSALAAQSMTMVSAAVQESRSNDVIDLFCDRDYENLQTRTQTNSDGTADVVEVDTIDPQFKAVKFRASEDVEQVTVGQGREFTLQAGRTYKAPRWVVEHLDTQGVVYH